MSELFYYVGIRPGFRQGLGPNDPDPDSAVLIFLDSDSAGKYIVDNHLEKHAHVFPIWIGTDPVVPAFSPEPLQIPLIPIYPQFPTYPCYPFWSSSEVTVH